MKKIKPKNYTAQKNFISDWTDETKYLIHYRRLTFSVEYGMVVDKVHEILSYKQSK